MSTSAACSSSARQHCQICQDCLLLEGNTKDLLPNFAREFSSLNVDVIRHLFVANCSTPPSLNCTCVLLDFQICFPCSTLPLASTGAHTLFWVEKVMDDSVEILILLTQCCFYQTEVYNRNRARQYHAALRKNIKELDLVAFHLSW